MKFLIADDHELFLQGLEFILRKEYPKADIVLTNSYTGIFKELEHHDDFDLIITDLAMPGGNWQDSLNKIHQLCLDVPIVIISAVFDKEILQKTFDIGVSGYVSKSFPNSLIIGAINLVMAGGMYIPPEVLKMSMSSSSAMVRDLVHDLGNIKKSTSKSDKSLTPRQLDVLRCLEKGYSNKQIANEMGLSEGTVKVHMTLLLRTLDVSNRVQAVHKGMKLGLIDGKRK